MADSAFDWTDPFLLEQELSEHERMVRDNARRFCQAKLSPRVRDDFRHERFERGVMAAMGDARAGLTRSGRRRVSCQSCQ